MALDHDFTIGITGGIGSGKSVVSRVLRCNGFDVYDCDSRARNLMEYDSEVKHLLIEELGKDIYFHNGTLNRKLLASILFGDVKVRNFVNGVVHQAVKKDILEQRKKLKGYFFIESAIIVSGGLTTLCDEFWLVHSELYERIRRIKKRDGISVEEIEKRLKSQEKELSGLPKDKTIVLENNDKNPLLPEIFKMILPQALNINQNYTISC